MNRRLLRRIALAVGVAAVVTGLCWAGLAAGVFAGFQDRATDALYPSAETDERVVVVGIDDESLNDKNIEERWPWPRDLQAQLLRDITRAGAEAVVFDIVYQSPTNGANDAAFAAALAEAPPTVLAAQIETTASPDDDIEVIDGGNFPIDQFADAASAVGHARVTPDGDGVVRTLPLVVEDENRNFLPALSLAAFGLLEGTSSPPTIRPDGLQVGDRFIPTEGDQALRLNYAEGLKSPDTAVISAVDVLNGEVPASKLDGKIVFVGATSPILGDDQLTPVDKSGDSPGVLVQANALNTLLTSSYMKTSSDTRTLVFVSALALAVALAVLLTPLWLSPIVAVVLFGGYMLLVFIRFDDGRILNIVYPLLAVLLAFVGALGVRYVTEDRHRRRVSALFAQYVPEKVAEQLVEEGRVDAASEGERLDATAMFCDLRGFTALSTTLTAAQVSDMLNRFYEALTEVILTNEGTVLKFVGDEVYAVFGAPMPRTNHVDEAVACAVAAQALGPRLKKDLGGIGIPEVKFGIGINCGEVVAAHVGGGRRRQYDVVGDTVNLASRLCSQAGPGEVVIPQQVLDRLTDKPAVADLGRIELKGISEPVRCYAIRTPIAEKAPA
ncbi:MAG: CHASE2 domain-containing protein [Acidimicrobiia bacterium]